VASSGPVPKRQPPALRRNRRKRTCDLAENFPLQYQPHTHRGDARNFLLAMRFSLRSYR